MWPPEPCGLPGAARHPQSRPAARPACQAHRRVLLACRTVPARGLEPGPPPAAPRLDEFASRSTLHGLQHIFQRGPFTARNLLWLLAFLALLCLLVDVYAERLGYYFQYPHITQLEEETLPGMVFPAVTLCNLNRARVSQLSSRDLYWAGELLGLLDGADRVLAPEDADVDAGILAALAGRLNLSAEDRARPFDLAELYERTAHRLDLGGMLLNCTFAQEPCSARDFQPVYTRYGKCYTFNGDRRNPRVARQGGMGNGLEIMLDIQQEEYLPIWRETNETSFEAGIRVQIHSQDEPPYIHQLGFGVSPGFQTFVSCQEQRLTYLPQPWGSCRASVPGEQTLPGYETYSIAACRLQCEKEAVVHSCHCRMVHMPGNESICSPNVYIECADHTLDMVVEDTRELCSCPTPCNLTRYGKEISMVRIPNKGSARYLARKYNRNETYIRENFLVLDIFFEALNYEAIEQKKAYDLAGLLGDIGGQMGLFIGASILTVLEILDYMYEVIRDRVNRALRRSKPPLKKPSGSIATLGLEELKDQSPCETLGRHVEGAYTAGILPNHHHRHHYSHQGVFEDFAC
ncbi:acid-sensing ion channel 4 isoform X1 [Alligator mississippiensis]|uniref:acid-sensing ion channel 4 isoform X1 n=1 Tax=Alligator mississippiensis TaxID=8496 RepID=UPI002877E881|nr:acid-sensing ion channel 4 isoform X1 [Alligator mississippiensis]